jgi:hypothetical protein
MKRCIVTHTHTSFGEIPVGSLWADDSPFLSDETAGYFETVDEEPATRTGTKAGRPASPAKRKKDG